MTERQSIFCGRKYKEEMLCFARSEFMKQLLTVQRDVPKMLHSCSSDLAHPAVAASPATEFVHSKVWDVPRGEDFVESESE